MSDETMNPVHNDPAPCSVGVYFHPARLGKGMFSIRHAEVVGGKDDDGPTLRLHETPGSVEAIATIFLSWEQAVEIRQVLREALIMYANATAKAKGPQDG